MISINKKLIIILFLGCLIINYAIWATIDSYTVDKQKTRFDDRTLFIQSQIINRIQDYENLLLSGKALFLSSDNVSKQEWKIFVDNLNIKQKSLGIQGIGYAPNIKESDKERYISEFKKDRPDYKFLPEGTRPEYYPISYLEPNSEINSQSLGYDMYGEEIRKDAIDRARDTGLPTLSHKIRLTSPLNGEGEIGFRLYVPLYAKNANINTIEDRRSSIQGVIYASFRFKDFIASIINISLPDIDLEIYDGESLGNQNIFFDSNNKVYDRNSPSLFNKFSSISIAGQTWSMVFEANDKFVAEEGFTRNILIPGLGVVVSILITFVIYLLSRSRQDALNRTQLVLQLLNETENKYKVVVDSLAEGIILQDAKGEVITFNQSTETLLGVTHAQMIGKAKVPKELYPIDEQGNKLDDKDHPFRKVQETLQPQLDVVIGIHKPNGDITWIKVNCLPIFSHDKKESGKLMYILNSFIDITKERANDLEIEAKTKELERSNSELEDFAYVASHDLQEPLRKITSFSNLLISSHKDQMPDSAREYLEIIDRASKRMSTLISDLLAYSRITTKAQPFDNVDLKSITTEVLSDLEVRIKTSQAKVDISKLPIIEADPLQMRQLFQNLISNALKYQKPDLPPVVTIHSEVTNRNVKIFVKDNGIGFDTKYHDRIFTIFQRLHGRSEYEGTGIGLAICKKIVERHQGKIYAESKEGEGSTFIVELPKKQS